MQKNILFVSNDAERDNSALSKVVQALYIMEAY